MKITCKGLEFKFNVSMEARVGEISEVSESKKESKDSGRMSSDNDHANDVEIKAGFDIGISTEEYSGEVDLSELTKMINEMIKTNVTDKVTEQINEQINREHKETESSTSSESENNKIRWMNEDTGEISDEPPKGLHFSSDYREVKDVNDKKILWKNEVTGEVTEDLPKDNLSQWHLLD